MRVPHVIPYQGSKRKIADAILENIYPNFNGTLFEPFSGSAAITLSAATKNIGKKYVIGDKYKPLIELWRSIINNPLETANQYETLWNLQQENPREFFNKTREQFNADSDPVKLLYLVTRCVKNAIRFNSNGEFNQSPDNRRLGTRPERVRREIENASKILAPKTVLRSGDFKDIIKDATYNDIVYMDPPWQGTSNKKDSRYAHTLEMDNFISGLEDLNERGVPFLLSFDGSSGKKTYGNDLPSHLNLVKTGINAGRSTQATLLGRNDITIESLYISPAFIENASSNS